MSREAAEKLSQDDRVESVTQAGRHRGHSTQYNPPWGLDRIDQASLPLSGSYSGIRPSHSECGGRASIAGDFIGGNGVDCAGHGTASASIIGGSTYGVAKGVTIHSLRVADCQAVGDEPFTMDALEWVMTYGQQPGVVYIGVGGGYDADVNDAVRDTALARFTVVVTAGNGNHDASGHRRAGAPMSTCLRIRRRRRGMGGSTSTIRTTGTWYSTTRTGSRFGAPARRTRFLATR
jgi:hypothetical protein